MQALLFHASPGQDGQVSDKTQKWQKQANHAIFYIFSMVVNKIDWACNPLITVR